MACTRADEDARQAWQREAFTCTYSSTTRLTVHQGLDDSLTALTLFAHIQRIENPRSSISKWKRLGSKPGSSMCGTQHDQQSDEHRARSKECTVLQRELRRGTKEMMFLRFLPSLFLATACEAFTGNVHSSITSTLKHAPAFKKTRTSQSSSINRNRRHLFRLSSSDNGNNADVLEALKQANLKAHVEVWESRRGMARVTLSAAKNWRGVRESLAGPPDASKGDSLVTDGKGALVISAVGVAVAAATLRVGGRAALMSVRLLLPSRVYEFMVCW